MPVRPHGRADLRTPEEERADVVAWLRSEQCFEEYYEGGFAGVTAAIEKRWHVGASRRPVQKHTPDYVGVKKLESFAPKLHAALKRLVKALDDDGLYLEYSGPGGPHELLKEIDKALAISVPTKRGRR